LKSSGQKNGLNCGLGFKKPKEIDELVAAIDGGIQAAEEGRVFSLEEIKMQMQSWITK